ncbi:hypothetical protein [Agromyces atrinae]|uniref:Integral membrane protein n=1 Tax=Agromyces atrinae TaxID=592376 RepID=A0A4Q2M2Y9_9MICO|nr:hypothetical protein [Agromyces atrinae]NYD65785.1 hypothetical protein [Agromyces atrinae]RXZ86138.1 hypothetical protein ESP50_10190 [Agromyces atrinae]
MTDLKHASTSARPKRRISGIGQVLIAVYAILAVGATGRSAVQVIFKFDEAPVAYSLSAVAAVVYIIATIALVARGVIWYRVAWATIVFEFVGVLTVGVLSLTVPEFFAHESVWSYFGRGYVFIPLVLPVLGMWWLAKHPPSRDPRVEGGAA